MNNSDSMNLLLEKYKFLWNHYKLQNEASEKRRYILWLIESAFFLAFYQFFDKRLYAFAFIITVLGIIISIIFFFVLRRDRESTFLTQEQLRDTEHQLYEINKEAIFNKFILDEEINFKQGYFLFKHSGRVFNNETIKEYWLFFKRDSENKESKCKLIEILKIINEFIEDLISSLKDKIGSNIFSVKYLLDYFMPILFLIIWIFFNILVYPYLLILWILLVFGIILFNKNKCSHAS